MIAQVLNYVSAEDYLKVERAATEKHELHEGQIVTMSGALLPESYRVCLPPTYLVSLNPAMRWKETLT